MNALRVYVALSVFSQDDPRPREFLNAAGFETVINSTGRRLAKPEVINCLKGFDAVLAGLEPYDRDVLEALPQLKCISRCGVGVDNIDLAVAGQKNIAVLNTPQVVVGPVAELTLGMILDLNRRLTAHTELMRQGRWERLTGRDLAGKTVGLIGLGRIGRRVAQILAAFDVRVLACDIAPDKVWVAQNKVELTGMDDLLSRSDIVSLHLSGKGGAALIGPREISLMKEGAILVNVARGSFVDEAALFAGLTSGHLSGAGLDVFGQEPYSGALAKLPNVVLTPHVGTLTLESRGAMELEAVNNLSAYLKSLS